MKPRLIILAGFRRSLPPLILLNALAARDDLEVAAVLCVNEYSLRRISTWQKRFGGQFLKKVLSVFGQSEGSVFDDERELLKSRVMQQQGTLRYLPKRCKELGIPFEIISGPNEPDGLETLKRYRPDFAIYAGGGILRQQFIESVPGGVLNVHSGPLPHVRGMSGPEWSLYLGVVPTATVHFIDPGIDTGAIVGEVSINITRKDTLGHIRGRTLLAGIDHLLDLLGDIMSGDVSKRENPGYLGRQYFEMAPLLKRVVQSWVRQGITPVIGPAEVDPKDFSPANIRHGYYDSKR